VTVRGQVNHLGVQPMSAQPGHPSVLSTVSTSKNWGINMHTARCTSPVSVIRQCKLVSGLGEISAVLWALWLQKDFMLCYVTLHNTYCGPCPLYGQWKLWLEVCVHICM